MEVKDKIPIHIGLFGHIDSGKTAIAAALSDIISTAGIDGHPQSKERGITIDLGFTSFMIDSYLITLVDAPGHADLIKISASSIEIIDIAMLIIDINKGPQIQTGEHIIMIESLGIKNIIVILNKIDLFKGDLQKEIENIKKFFSSTSYGSDIPIFPVSAKNKIGIEQLKRGILDRLKKLEFKREIEGETIIPIDHYFTIKGKGAIITGTILKGTLSLNQNLEIIPIKVSGKVKSIQIFRQNVDFAKAGDRVGVNLKNIDVKEIYRGCYATNNPAAFNHCNIIEVKVNNNKLFKPETHFGTQVHVIIGMFTAAANIFPYYELDGKKVQLTAPSKLNGFKAFLWFNEKVLLRKGKSFMLISRLDLPPTTLRILGSAELIQIHEEAPLIYKYKIKKGYVQNPDHPNGIVCMGLAQSTQGAEKLVGKQLEPPYTKIFDSFGTKGAVIIGIENQNIEVKKGDPVILKELRSFRLKKI